jgi:hypothetical protein
MTAHQGDILFDPDLDITDIGSDPGIFLEVVKNTGLKVPPGHVLLSFKTLMEIMHELRQFPGLCRQLDFFHRHTDLFFIWQGLTAGIQQR